MAATITQSEFWAMAEVTAAQDAQKCNPFGSTEHRAAHGIIWDLAVSHGVSEWFESMEEYDDANKRIHIA